VKQYFTYCDTLENLKRTVTRKAPKPYLHSSFLVFLQAEDMILYFEVFLYAKSKRRENNEK
jgi:hypothetical protein